MLLYTGSSLSCYQCDSNEDADCTEYFDHEHFADLTIRSTECAVDAAKYCIKTTGVWGGKPFFVAMLMIRILDMWQ